MAARVRRGKTADKGGDEGSKPRGGRAREQVKHREAESRSSDEKPGEPGAATERVNVGFRLTVKRTDDAVRDAVGDYGSVEVSVSMHEDVPVDRRDAEFSRIRESVESKVAEAFVSLGVSEEPEDEGEDD